MTVTEDGMEYAISFEVKSKRHKILKVNKEIIPCAIQ